MTKEKDKEKKVEEPKKGIVISETEEDVVLGSNTGDPDDFKNEVKKEAEKGKAWRVLMPILVFLMLGAVVAYGTYYYQKQSENATPKKVEEKIQTPPTVDDADTTTPTDTPADTNPDTPVSDDSSTTTDYTTYTVKSGDTLSSVANTHDMTSSELAKYNGISVDDFLQIGQKLKIPNN